MIDPFDIPNLLSTYGYIGVFVVVFLESGIFFALPGDSLLFTAGLLASGIGLKIHLLIPLIFVAGFLGSIAGYIIGMYVERLHKYKFFQKILRQDYIDKAHTFFEKHGLYAVVLSRFVPIVRTFLPIVAGVVRMNFVKFSTFSLMSSLTWSLSITSLGYFLGMEFPMIKNYMHHAVFLIILVSSLPVIFEWWRGRRAKLS